MPANFIRQCYNADGNLTADANKKISSITYNHLNLPAVITVTGKGTITYTYDAAGNKLKKVTIDNTASPAKTTTTLYLWGTVFENDTLQFMAHEDGRIRPVRDVNKNITGFVYDYFIRDHLGNVRMVLTDEEKQDMYPPASMETAQAEIEEALYANISETRVTKPAGYPTDNYTNPNGYVAKTAGNGNKMGPSIILKVMSGDKLNIRVSSWYKTGGTNPGSPNSMASDLVAAFINSLTGMPGFEHGTAALANLENSGVVPTALNSFLGSQPAPGSTKPKAYLNWVLLDEQFKFVQNSSGAEQVGNDEEFKVHTKAGLSVTKNGYLYVFVSNETPNMDVYFDNLQITHDRGAILEETHYYPFGLTMAGISSKALQFGGVENRFKYNGKEEQRKEFSDGSGLEWLDYGARMYDNQLGRWMTVDPLAESMPEWTPYNFTFNNPLSFIDTDGMAPDWIIGTDGKKVTYTHNEDGSLNWSKNVSEDIKRVGGILSGTEIGATVLKDMINSKHGISIKIDKENIIKTAGGGYEFGNAIPTITTKTDIKSGRVLSTELVKTSIIINEATIREYESKYKSMVLTDGTQINISNLTIDDLIGSNAVHEGTHATDRRSIMQLNPNLAREEIEKKPLENQKAYHKELEEKRDERKQFY